MARRTTLRRMRTRDEDKDEDEDEDEEKEIAFILFLNREKLVHLVVVVFSLSSGSFSLSFAQISDFNADFISVNSRLPDT